jgi:hypothetical protein
MNRTKSKSVRDRTAIDTQCNPVPERQGRGSQAGYKKRGGRQKGTPNKVTSTLNKILQSGVLVGDRIKEEGLGANPKEKAECRANFPEGGLLGYLKWLAVNRPGVYCGILKKLIPKVTRRRSSP